MTGRGWPWPPGEAGEHLCLAVILLGLAAALVVQAWRVGVTVDGPSHLLSSYLYWHGADRLQPRDMPPLIKIAGGWAPSLFRLPIPYDHPAWKSQHEWLISMAMMERMSGPQIQRVFFYSRLPLLIFPLLTAWLVWRWGRELFGARVGLLLALAYALEPTALAHGAVFKNDAAATFGYLLFWYTAWRFWRNPRPGNAAWLGVGTLIPVLAKLSMLLLVAIAPVIVLLRHLSRRQMGWRSAAIALALVLLIPYLGTLGAYQFETRRLPAAELAAHARDPRLPRPFVLAAHVFNVLPVPVAMWQGATSLFHSNAGGNPVYLLGKLYPQGHRLYFLIALAVKAPVPLQILAACGAILLAIRIRRKQFEWTDLFWLLPPALYIGLASLSSLQLGVRLILPALPFGLLLCGVAVAGLMRGPRVILLIALFAWLAVKSVWIYPHGIAFFNLWTGGPEHGLDYLADSNLDWGEDLRSLAQFVKEREIPRIHLSYFGNDNPWAYFGEDQLILVAPPWHEDLVKGPVPYEPRPGYYAVSANLLPGHFFQPRYRDFYKRFQEMEPIERVGYSIYIYKVGERYTRRRR